MERKGSKEYSVVFLVEGEKFQVTKLDTSGKITIKLLEPNFDNLECSF